MGGQVGIGVLILFTAMLIVAVIAGGVLLETGGFLQSSGEQTGEQSSKQGSDRLQVLSAVGTVTNVATPTTDVIGIQDINDRYLYIDSGATATVEATGESTLTHTGGSANEVTVNDGDTLRFEKVDSSTVRITNEDTTDSPDWIEFDIANDLEIKDSDSNGMEWLNYNFVDSVYGDTTKEVHPLHGGIYDVRFETRTESFVELEGADDVPRRTLLISNGETVTVGSDTDDNAELENGDGDTLPVSEGDDLTFTTDADARTFTIEDEAGETLTVGAEGTLDASDSGTVELQTDGAGITPGFTGGPEDEFLKTGTPDTRYLFTREIPNARADLAVTQLDLIVGGGPGAGDLDLESSTVMLITDQGNAELTYDSEFAVEGETFTANPITDDGDTFPVLTTGDRFEIIIDPGDLDPETDVFISISTVGGQETERIRIPANLLREGTISL